MFENKVLDDVNGHAPLLRLLTVLIGPVCDACWCNSTDRLHVSMCHDNMYQHSRGNHFEIRSHYGLPPSFSSIYYPSSIIIQLTYERGEACSTGRDSKCIKNIGWKTQGNTLERDTRKLEDNNWGLQRLVCKGVEWIYLANDKVNWKALVKRVIKLRPA